MDSVYEFADYVAYIENGRIAWYGNAKSIKNNNNKSLKNFIKGVC